jgi:hypothetical protein
MLHIRIYMRVCACMRVRVCACACACVYILSSSLQSKYVNIKMCRTIILPAVLYGCKTWSLALRQECKLRVFRNTWVMWA